MSFHLGIHPHVKPTNIKSIIKECRAFIIGSKEEEKKSGVFK
jgi:hypothetical protein